MAHDYKPECNCYRCKGIYHNPQFSVGFKFTGPRGRMTIKTRERRKTFEALRAVYPNNSHKTWNAETKSWVYTEVQANG